MNAELDSALTFADQHHAKGVVIMHAGRIVAERYWSGWSSETNSVISSASKSIVSILIGKCLTDGIIKNLDQSAADFLSGFREKPQKAITIRHLLSMTSGLEKPFLWAVRPGVQQNEREFGTSLSLQHKPGSTWDYHTFAYRLLFPIIEEASGTNLADYTREKLFEPLGMSHSYWRSRKHDGTTSFLNLVCSARDMARFGTLVQQYGNWEGKQIVSREYVKAAMQASQPHNRNYGYLFWLNGPQQRLLPDCPPDAVLAMGAHNTRIYIVPSLKLVVTRLGNRFSPPGEKLLRNKGNPKSFHNVFMRMICDAIYTDEAVYHSRHISPMF